MIDGGACPLYIAARNGRVDTVRALLERGADVSRAKVTGATPLIGAVAEDHTDVVKILLENGADVNLVNIDGATPVYIASYRGHTAALKLLLENGGNVNKRGRRDRGRQGGARGEAGESDALGGDREFTEEVQLSPTLAGTEEGGQGGSDRSGRRLVRRLTL